VARKGCSERQACRFFAMHRATCRYRPKLPCLRQQQIEQAVVDEYTREVLALHVERNIGSGKVREVMERLVVEHGAPGYIRSDNGPEFVARNLQNWLAEKQIKTLYIEPGSP
jgi:putative transposase